MANLRPALTAAAMFSLFIVGSEAFAQQRTTGGTTGIGGTTGAAAGGGGVTGGVGSGNTASSAFNSGSLNNAGDFSAASSFGVESQAQSGGFVGRNDTAGRFVGNSQAGATNAAPQTPNFSGRGGSGAGSQFNTSQSTAKNLNVVRPQLKIAFTFPSVPKETVTAALGQQIDSMLKRKKLEGVNFTIDDKSVVTLKGEVATGEDARLIAILARMEPGIRGVKNEIKAKDYEENPDEAVKE